MKQNTVAILGGGLSGLILGSRLHALGVPFSLFETNTQVGGLARTLHSGRFSWDLGVHALYSKNPELTEIIRGLPLEYRHCRRKVEICHVRGEAVYPLDYPFENGLGGLPPEDLEECLEGYRQSYTNLPKSFANLQEWIEKGLGNGFSRVFMTPYNKKIWSEPLDNISMDLVSGKIEPLPYDKVLACARGEQIEGRGYQARFVYPRQGIQAFCDYFKSLCNGQVHTDMAVTHIEERADGYLVRFENGEVCKGYSHIVSTIPLKRLIEMTPWPEPRSHLGRLRHNDTLFVLVGLRPGRVFGNFDDNHWTFFAGDEVFYRLTMMHNFSVLFPSACVAEHTIGDDHCSPPEIAGRVVQDIARRGILKSMDDVETVETHFEPFTYPIPTIGLRETKEFLDHFFASKKIFLLGRNGNWDYINMDQVLSHAHAMAKRIYSHVSRE